jgi:hypothetical protein
MKLRILDVLAVIVAAGAVTGVSIFVYGDTPEPTQVSIQSDAGLFLYPLNRSLTVELAGPIGSTYVEIEDDRVRVLESPCRDQICVAAGWLDSTGQWTACLPNRVFVRVEGGQRSDGVDAQTF